MTADLGAACELAPAPNERSLEAAGAAGLRFSADCEPGFKRLSDGGSGFRYVRDGGEPVTGAPELARIERLKIPPAWTRVWICEDERGHLQATGYDARGRKQYRYHEDWRQIRDATKFDRLVEFGEALPAIRARVDQDLRHTSLDHDRVLALVVSLMDRTFARVGNPEYLKANESFGLTTLKDEHAEVSGARIRLRFRGKAGKEFELRLDDPRLARALKRAKDLPGEELFQYVDASGERRVVGSGDVNDYLKSAAGTGLTSKDFRTWGGSLTVACALLGASRMHERPHDRHVSEAVKQAAELLGNTPAVCRRSYVHPGLIAQSWADAQAHAKRDRGGKLRWLSEDERIFLALASRLGDGEELL